MSYVVTEACIDVLDRSCVEECPVDCIYPGDRMAYIHPDECVDCGKCVPACPSDAIHWEYRIPADQAEFVLAASEFVATHGLGGGAGEQSVGADHPLVAARKPA